MKRRPVVIIRKRSAPKEGQESPKAASGADAATTGRRPPQRGSKSPPRGGVRRGTGIRKKPQWKRSKEVDPEKVARRVAAKELSEAAGIPVAHAHRVLQGKTTLNEVLKSLMHRAKREGLVQSEGLDPSLAGQVVAGHLTIERARVISEMRRLRPHSVAKDGFQLAARSDDAVALQLFGASFAIGKVTEADVYEYVFQPEGSEETQRFTKHDVKVLVLDATTDLESLLGIDKEVAKAGLAGTGETSDRVRVPDEVLLDAIANGSAKTLVCRDGTTVKGRVVCFSRWDVELSVPPLTGGAEVSVIVFNHALHPKSASAGS